MKHVLQKGWRRFRARDGNATIEFVMWFPLFLTLFLTSFELSIYGMRSMMLERAVDLNVRGMRLGNKRPNTVDEFKLNVCNETILLGDCLREISVDVRRIDTTSWALPTDAIGCVDRTQDYKDPENVEYGPGGSGDLLLIRVCVNKSPFFGTTPWVMGLPRDPSGGVSIVALSTYVNEP
ncbi:TadE/TadG family type IV pilus assembly protein [uncultured Aliiroseovarius sp.]|uniref:TadE/TadG family type IV pilus assembly protein n=1 Tax=uncultured Aliiroseovarius sp. TaxID=1658783 RepID=UPI002594DB13|nr:TadE/TadG family type IV pilus assembly protein [uncultured Aliiroseovarius sp.]